jgi:hypothetical protein
LNQKEAKDMQQTVSQVYEDWERELDDNGTNGNWARWRKIPMFCYVSKKKHDCSFCNRYILMGEIRTSWGSHVSCFIRQTAEAVRLVEVMKVKLQEQDKEIIMNGIDDINE